MRYRFRKDWNYNLNGGWSGRRKAKKGDVIDLPFVIAQALVKEDVVEVLDAKPSQNKVVKPQMQKAKKSHYIQHAGGPWFEVKTASGSVVDKVRGKEDAEQRAEELNA